MVAIRVDRLRAAQLLDGRPWPEIARSLKTTHPRLFHLTNGDGPDQRRCRRSLRDGFAGLFGVDRRWLSGETDALAYVLAADASIVCLDPNGRRRVETRWSMLEGTPPESPAVQLALDRVLARADAALRRDIDSLTQGPEGKWGQGDLRAYALLLVAQSVEAGIELVRPLPPIAEATQLRLSAIQHMSAILGRWLDGRGAFPDWDRIYEDLARRIPPKDGRGSLLLFMHTEGMSSELSSIYRKIEENNRLSEN